MRDCGSVRTERSILQSDSEAAGAKNQRHTGGDVPFILGGEGEGRIGEASRNQR
jgi:hypothetical protein